MVAASPRMVPNCRANKLATYQPVDSGGWAVVGGEWTLDRESSLSKDLASGQRRTSCRRQVSGAKVAAWCRKGRP